MLYAMIKLHKKDEKKKKKENIAGIKLNISTCLDASRCSPELVIE